MRKALVQVKNQTFRGTAYFEPVYCAYGHIMGPGRSSNEKLCMGWCIPKRLTTTYFGLENSSN